MSHNQIVSLLNAKIRDRDTDLAALRAHIATYVRVSADQQGEIERLQNALATCVETLKRIEMRTLDDYPPFRSAPVEAFLPIIRQALVAARDAGQAALTKES